MAEDIKLRELHTLRLVEAIIRNIYLAKLSGLKVTAKDVDYGH